MAPGVQGMVTECPAHASPGGQFLTLSSAKYSSAINSTRKAQLFAGKTSVLAPVLKAQRLLPQEIEAS
jgi:hypothetical protein